MSTRGFGCCLANTLIPGGKLANGVEAPEADCVIGEAELTAWLALEGARPALEAIGQEAGNRDAFVAATPERRVEILHATQSAHPASFHNLVTALLTLYYEDADVVHAFGWRSAPPQPDGHRLEGMDEGFFEAVKAHGPVWRKAD